MERPLPDNGIPVKIGDTSYVYKDVYHPIVWIGEEPYRPRVETMVIKDGNKLWIKFHDQDENERTSDPVKLKYEFPGGSLDADSSMDQQAINEVNEEALISIKNVYNTGIQYYQTFTDYNMVKYKDQPVTYRGFITYIYIAEYNGGYDKKNIEKKDLAPEMVKYGKFRLINAVADQLSSEHYSALIQCPYVDKNIIRSMNLLSNVRGITLERSSRTRAVFMGKGKMELSDLKKIPITPQTYDMAISSGYKFSMPIKFTNNRGFMYLYNGKMVCYINTNLDSNNVRWITAMEVLPKYRGYTLGDQMVEVAVSSFDASNIKIEYDNQVAFDMFTDHGYATYRSDGKYNYLTLNNHIVNEGRKLETTLLTNPFDNYMILYHGTDKKLEKIQPVSYNAGSRFSDARVSSYWALDIDISRLFMIKHILTSNNIKAEFETIKNLIVKRSEYNKAINILKGSTGYIYVKKIHKKYLGTGQSNYFDEFTIDLPVVPDKRFIQTYKDFEYLANSIRIYPSDNPTDILKYQKEMRRKMLDTKGGNKLRPFVIGGFDKFVNSKKSWKKDLCTVNADMSDYVLTEAKMSSKERNSLDDSEFGIPELRKYPLTDEDHVKSAIRFFNKVDSEHEEELANNIKKRINELDIDVDISEDNRLYKYIHESVKYVLEADDDEDMGEDDEDTVDYTDEADDDEVDDTQDDEDTVDYTDEANNDDSDDTTNIEDPADDDTDTTDNNDDTDTDPTDDTTDTDTTGDTGDTNTDVDDPADDTTDEPEDGTDDDPATDDTTEDTMDYTDQVDDADDTETDTTDDKDDTDEDTETVDDDTENTDQEDEQKKNNVVKNYNLAKDFQRLYQTIGDIISKLEFTVFKDETQNSVVSRILSNLRKLSNDIVDYMEYSFRDDDYITNLYNYTTYVKALEMIMEMFRKTTDLVSEEDDSSDTKTKTTQVISK